MSAIETVVDNNHRAIIVTQRAPAQVIGSVVPVHPGRPPTPCGDPVPSQATPPMPSAVMGNTPSPRLIRTPCPPADRVPNPSSMIIGPPGIVVDIRNPHIPIGSFIHPPSVVVQFGLIFIHFHREIPRSNIPVVKDISSPIPFCKSILISSIDVLGTQGEKSVGCGQSFSGADYFIASFASGFDGSFHHKKCRFLVIPDLEAVKPFLQNIK